MNLMHTHDLMPATRTLPMRKNPLCAVRHLPKWLRMLMSRILICFGFLLWLTPFPGGIILISVGCMLIYCASPEFRAKILRRFPKKGRFARMVRRWLKSCDNCPNGKKTDTPSAVSSLPENSRKRP